MRNRASIPIGLAVAIIEADRLYTENATALLRSKAEDSLKARILRTLRGRALMRHRSSQRFNPVMEAA